MFLEAPLKATEILARLYFEVSPDETFYFLSSKVGLHFQPSRSLALTPLFSLLKRDPLEAYATHTHCDLVI